MFFVFFQQCVLHSMAIFTQTMQQFFLQRLIKRHETIQVYFLVAVLMVAVVSYYYYAC